jgi:hypothetical protein
MVSGYCKIQRAENIIYFSHKKLIIFKCFLGLIQGPELRRRYFYGASAS